jgi:hypothetical protein
MTVYVTRPPTRIGGSPPLSIVRMVRQSFESADGAADPELTRFLDDLLAQYGMTRGARPIGQQPSYAEMGQTLLRRLVPGQAAVDLVVVAHSVPETDPRMSAAHLVNQLCPGDPLTFAICDRGTAIPFTALAMMREYAPARAILLLAEQGPLPYDCPGETPSRSTAVAMVLEPTGQARITGIRQHTNVAPGEAGELVSKALAGCPDALVVGRHVPSPFRTGPAGQLCTAVWWALADGLPGWLAAGRPVVVADYDPPLRQLCLATIEPGR